MKLKFFLVFLLLAGEAVYAGKMVLHSSDPGVVKTVLGIPVLGEMFYDYRIEGTRTKAAAGDVHEMMALYYKAQSMDRQRDVDFAVELLDASETATAKLFLAVQDSAEVEQDPSREFLLLVARAMRENIRPFVADGDANSVYTHQSRQYARAFEILQKQAEEGDPDAVWVMDQIGLLGGADAVTAGG